MSIEGTNLTMIRILGDVARRGCKEIEVMTLSGDQLYGFYRLDKATRVTNTPSKKRRKNSHPNQGGQGGGGTGGRGGSGMAALG